MMKRFLLALIVFLSLAIPALAQGPTYTTDNYRVIIETQTFSIAAAQIDSAPTPSTAAREVEVQLKFGTVTGTYTTCTMQAKTSLNGTDFLTIGSAVTVTATTGTINAWRVIEQIGTTTVTTGTASSTIALGFGRVTKFTFNCSGGFGTTAPATLVAIYR